MCFENYNIWILELIKKHTVISYSLDSKEVLVIKFKDKVFCAFVIYFSEFMKKKYLFKSSLIVQWKKQLKSLVLEELESQKRDLSKNI